MNARLFGSSPYPRASPNSGGLLEFYPPQNWLARGAKSYPNSVTPDTLQFLTKTLHFSPLDLDRLLYMLKEDSCYNRSYLIVRRGV